MPSPNGRIQIRWIRLLSEVQRQNERQQALITRKEILIRYWEHVFTLMEVKHCLGTPCIQDAQIWAGYNPEHSDLAGPALRVRVTS